MNRRMEVPTKAERLEHYATREPHRFYQFDGFWCPEGGDSVMRPDEQDHCLFSRETYELMSGGPHVRVLITPGTPRPEALALLRKIIAWIDQDNVFSESSEEYDLSAAGEPEHPVI